MSNKSITSLATIAKTVVRSKTEMFVFGHEIHVSIIFEISVRDKKKI